LTLYASNPAGRQKWLEFIDTAQQRLRARADFLNTTVITAGFFGGTNKVNCVAPFGMFDCGWLVAVYLFTDARSQTAAASSSTEPTTASTSRTAGPRTTPAPSG